CGARLQLPAHADARGADARARLRKDQRPLTRARGPLCVDGGGVGDGESSAGGHRLDPGRQRGARARRDEAPAREAPRVPGRLPAVASGRDGAGLSVHEPEKTIALDAEYLSGHRFPYQEDIALVEEVDLLAATP